MKTPLLFVLLLGFAASLLAEDLVLENGKKLAGVTISRKEPDGLVVMTDDGIIKVRFADLPEETRKKYGYDPAAAAAFSTAVHQSQSATVAKSNAMETAAYNKAQADAVAKDRAEQMQKLAFRQKVRVIQLVTDGALVRFLGGPSPTYFIRGFSQGVDGDDFELVLYPAGKFKYEATSGAAATVRAYATSADDALASIAE